MKVQFFFAAIIFICNLHASNSSDARLVTIKKYSFSDSDRDMFFNYETQEMESPYSTGSVGALSTDTLVTIEEDAYNKLCTHALSRSNALCERAMQDQRNTPQENYNASQCLKNAVDVSAKSREKFRSMQPVVCYNSRTVLLSQQDLMRLLQWSHGITTVFLMMTGSKHDFMLEIKTGNTVFTAPPLLKNFMIEHADHDQEGKTRWAN